MSAAEITQWEHAHTHAMVVLNDVWKERDSRGGERLVDVIGFWDDGRRGMRIAIRSRDRKVRRRLIKGCLRYVAAPAFVARFVLLQRKRMAEAVKPAEFVFDRIEAKFALHRLLGEVAAERARQDSIFGVQQLPDGTGGGGRKTYETIARNWCDRATREGILTFADILDEEVAEALAETDPVKLRTELLQAAAVCCKWVTDLDRRAAIAKQEGGS